MAVQLPAGADTGSLTATRPLISFGQTKTPSAAANLKAAINQQVLPLPTHLATHWGAGEQWFTGGHLLPLENLDFEGFNGYQSADYAYFQVCVEVPDLSLMRAVAEKLYGQCLTVARKLGKTRLVRIWNYIPGINEGRGDDECYRQFCWGRAEALGDTVLPAATGIGSRDGVLRIGVLCTAPVTDDTSEAAIKLQHLENPRQVSAYHYPRDYGPRSPSFARATLIGSSSLAASSAEPHSDLLLLSGTASIVEHKTRHPHDLPRQSQETAANINALLNTLNRPASPVALRYYLRRESQIEEAVECWKAHFFDWPLPTFYAGDICRAELELEVEGVFSV